MNSNSFSQKIAQYEWENRVLMVFTDDKDSKKFKEQIELLKNEKEGLEERKLIVFQVLPNFFNFNFEKRWNPSPSFHQKYNPEKADFKIILIGLDGGIKLHQNEILTTEKLFAIIDGMPIRKNELRNKKN